MKNNREWLDYKDLIADNSKLFIQSETHEIIFDEDIVENFEKEHGVKIGVVYKSNFNMLIVDLVKSSDILFAYERIIPRNTGAVVTVPIFEDKFVVLKQYRHTYRNVEYSFPRGFGEPNITAFDNVKKELKEEIGGTVKAVSFLGKLAPDSGLTSNVVDVYSCNLESYEMQDKHEGILDIILLTEDELKSWIKDNKIIDGFTISAFFLYLNTRCLFK